MVRLLRIATVVAFTAHLFLLVRPDAAFSSRPFQEDAFYSLSVARSLAAGSGLTIDGVHATNGVQPLICFLDAPLFAAVRGAIVPGLRLAMLLQIVILAGAVFGIASFASALLRREEDRRPFFWLVAAAVSASYMLANGMLNGLETGLSTGLVFWVAYLYQRTIADRVGRVPIPRLLLIGAALGVAVLARIDEAFLVAGILATHLWLAHRAARGLQGADRRRSLVRVVVECMIIGAASVIVSAPWWIYNVTTFGSLLPISGQAQQMLYPDRWVNIRAAVLAIADSIMVLVSTPRPLAAVFPLLGSVATIVALVLLFATTRGLPIARSIARARRTLVRFETALPVVLYSAAIVVYYTFFFGAPHFIVRYFMPLRVLIAVGMIAFLAAAWRAAAPRTALRIGIASLATIALAASVYGFSWNFTDHNTNLYMGPVRWISEHVGAGERVGMFQSGTTGFYHPNVWNLDGKVNVGALRAMQGNRMGAYVDSMRFEYLIDWPAYVEPLLEDRHLRGWYSVVDTLPGDFVIWRRLVMRLQF